MLLSWPMSVKRWWIYQAERFPLIPYSVLVLVFSGAALTYRSRLLQESGWPPLWPWAVAFGLVLISFLHLRIADEFKDHEEDRQYRPDRPVPRGLVTLPELAYWGVGTALLQIGLALSLTPWLLLPLGLQWLYFGLMSQEFFARAWLRNHPGVYLLSHSGITPLITFLAAACDWLPIDIACPPEIVWLLLISWGNGLTIELGRKIRAPQQEQVGVETYSALWGLPQAAMIWLAAVGFTCGVLLILAPKVAQGWVLTAEVIGLGLLSVTIVYRCCLTPATAPVIWIDRLASLWTLGIYSAFLFV